MADRFTTVTYDDTIIVIDSGVMGPAGRDGADGKDGNGSGGGLFILDVTPTSGGVVGIKTHQPTVPANKVVSTCVSDTPSVRIHVGLEGGPENYSPTVDIEGVQVTLTESSTVRWFTGYADIVLTEDVTKVTATADTGSKAYVDIALAGEGPKVLSCVFGPLPGTQTALKAGDTIGFTLTTEPEAVEVTLLAGGASDVTRTFTVSNGTVSGTLTVGSTSASAGFSFKARNLLGTYGDILQSIAIPVDQTYPSFSSVTVQYPGTQQALGAGDQATVSCTVSNASSVAYSATGMSVASPSTYAVSKTLTNTSVGYVASGTNYTITATRASNGAVAAVSSLVKIATIAPTAAITTSPSGRMVGSPTGVLYEVRVTPSQTLAGAPTMNASLGAWSGSWTWGGSYWRRSLQISDGTPRGNGLFSGLDMVGLSGIHGTSITSGDTYVVGGLTSRTLTFPAFSRVAAIGAAVADQTKTSAQIVGGNVLTRYTDNTVRANGYYIANADGSYNPTGTYLALSDSVFAGSNTSGTLQVSMQETA